MKKDPTNKAAGKLISLLFVGVLMSIFSAGWYAYEYFSGNLESKDEIYTYLFNGGGFIVLIVFTIIIMKLLSDVRGY